MEFRMHGANPKKLYELFNIEPPKRIIDFSTNTNVLDFNISYDIDLKELISEYPDDDCLELRTLIAKNNNVDISNILVGNGSNELIYIIASYLQGKKVCILGPTYSEYKRALDSYDIKFDYIYDLNEALNYEVLFMCNPNNPTGKYIETNLIEELLNKNITVILDEAYVDFLYQEHKVIDVNKYNNIFILRSLTKTYHLSGIRLGYVLSHSDNIKLLKKRHPTWSVNAISLELAKRFMNDSLLVEKTKRYYEVETNRFANELIKLGYNVLDTSVNYFLVEVENDIEFIRYLLTKGIVVRHTRNFPTLDGKYVRIATKTEEENNYFLNCIKEKDM